MRRRRGGAFRPSSRGRASASITPRLRGSTSGCASWRQAPVSGLWEWSFVVSFWVVGASDSGLTPWRSNPGGGKSPLAIESIDNRYCQSPRGVMRSRPAELALIYEWQRGLSQQYSPLLWKLYIPAIGKFRPALRSIQVTDQAAGTAGMKLVERQRVQRNVA